MMWSNFLGRFSLERECVDFWVKGGKDFELYEYLAFSLSVALLSLPLRGEIWTNIFFGTIHKQSNSGDFSAMGKPYCGGGWAEK